MEDSKIVEIVLKECNNLENMLNDVFLPQFIKIHRADPKYNQLKLKQEVLASNAVFFMKKKYALFIINKEGKTVSEYDIKGMIMRRSNFPAYSKEKVQTLIDMILKEESIDIIKIRNFIIDTELEVNKLCAEGSKTIAGAVSYSKSKEEYKKIPFQILAMENWNLLEYKYFAPGTKGYLFRVLGIDTAIAPKRILDNMKYIDGQIKHAVIPYEEEKLPEYYILDLTAQKKFVWSDRVKEVIGVLQNNKFNSEVSFQ
jgi:hypothetical protein